MTNEKKRYKVTIFGQEYALVSSESEELVQAASRLVDDAMQEIAGKSASIDHNKVAVLAALRIASHLMQIKQDSEHQMKRQEALVASIDELFAAVLGG